MLTGVTRNVVFLGLVSLLNDLASEMLYPIIPLFVVGSLGASPALLGLIEGVAEGLSSGLRWVGGAWSDRVGRRKPFIVAGYGLSAISKPLMGVAAFALGWPLFLVGRCSDRLGKAVRTAARDALIADSSAPAHRGVAFGFHRAMDTCGAILGPLGALAIVLLWPSTPLATIFIVALAPGLACVLLAASAVREVPRAARPTATPALLQAYPRPFWVLLAAFGIFSLGNSSDSFLILRSKDMGLSFPQVILAYALFNVVFALAATPLGRLSDRIGRRPVVMAGWFLYALVYLGFAWCRAPLAPWVLLSIYGLYQALTDGVTKALISDMVPADQRAGAIGLAATVAGFGQLGGSLLAGAVWNVRVWDGQVMLPFVIGAVCALAAIPVIGSLPLVKSLPRHASA